MSYRVRAATLDDVDVLVGHRVAMFRDMGINVDASALEPAFGAWLRRMLPSGNYRAWLVEHVADDRSTTGIVAGGGVTILPWPPGPRYPGDTLAFVYNVYTEPAHRRQGLGRLVMETVHAWCRTNGVSSLALNASRDGSALYERLGYLESSSPMMFKSLVEDDRPPRA